MKTTIVLEIERTKPLPDRVPLTDIVAQRVYGYLFSQGAQVGVSAQLAPAEVEPTPA